MNRTRLAVASSKSPSLPSVSKYDNNKISSAPSEFFSSLPSNNDDDEIKLYGENDNHVEDVEEFLQEEQTIEKQQEGIVVQEDDKEEEADEENDEKLAPQFDDGDDDDQQQPFQPAPRTHKGPYNEINPNEKYFLYSPSGGFNNQREEVVYAMEIARLLNRTLYVPMAGRHTNFYSTYERLFGPADLFEMDRIMDFPFMETYGVRLVPLNTTVPRMVNRFAKQMGANKIEILFHPERPSKIEAWHKTEVLAMKSIKKSLLYLRGRGFYHKWFPTNVVTKIRKHTRYSEYLRKLAMKIVSKTFNGTRNFYAMHIRLGDYRAMYNSVSMFISGMVKTARSRDWKMRKFPVYVATDDVRKTGEDFGSIYSSFSKVMFANDVPKDAVKEFRSLFPPKSKMKDDMLGILEQLICTQALDFVGTSTSTFSAYIDFMRALRGYQFPEIGAVKPPPSSSSIGAGADGESDSNKVDTQPSSTKVESEQEDDDDKTEKVEEKVEEAIAAWNEPVPSTVDEDDDDS